MIFRVTFKTPDAIDSSIEEMADALEEFELFKKELKEFTNQWVTYGEYVTIEFNTDNNTATVIRKD